VPIRAIELFWDDTTGHMVKQVEIAHPGPVKKKIMGELAVGAADRQLPQNPSL
jgi:hypothetical protein